jgi:hypothetical protein
MGPTALLPLRRKRALRIFITHKHPPSSVGLEPATEYPVGPVPSTLTTRPPRAKYVTLHNNIDSEGPNKRIPKSWRLLCNVKNTEGTRPAAFVPPSETKYLLPVNSRLPRHQTGNVSSKHALTEEVRSVIDCHASISASFMEGKTSREVKWLWNVKSLQHQEK